MSIYEVVKAIIVHVDGSVTEASESSRGLHGENCSSIVFPSN